MAADFPTSIPAIQRLTAGDYMNSPGKEGDVLHNKLSDEIEAIATAIGVTGSVVAESIEKRLADVQDGLLSVPGDIDASITSAISDNGLLGYVPAIGGNAGVFVMSPYDAVDGTLSNVYLCTTSSDPYSSSIGVATKPLGVSGTNSDPAAAADAIMETPWVVDSGYVAGAAGVSTILGGYDHVNNQIAGTVIGGGHNYVQYNVNGHSSIVGGSNNRISGGRSIIAGGSSCTVNGGANLGAIVGGEYNTCQGSRSVILGGLSNTILSTATYSVIVGGRSGTIGTGVDYGVILGGQTNNVTHDYAVVMGQDGLSSAVGSFVVSRTKLAVAGDCQSLLHTYGLRTTNNTAQNMTQYWIMPAGVKAACTFSCRLVGMDEQSGQTAIFTFSGGVTWDGASTATVFADAGGSGTALNFTQIIDQIGCEALPQFSVTVGSLRPKVTGKAATNIKWSAYINGVITRM